MRRQAPAARTGNVRERVPIGEGWVVVNGCCCVAATEETEQYNAVKRARGLIIESKYLKTNSTRTECLEELSVGNKTKYCMPGQHIVICFF